MKRSLKFKTETSYTLRCQIRKLWTGVHITMTIFTLII